MIHIKELFRLQDIQHLRLIAGQDGLERTVTAAVLFEYDPSRVQLPDFYRGDLVVTTLAYARGDAQLVAHSLQALMNQGIASLMVKTAYFSELPQSVIALANRLGVPHACTLAVGDSENDRAMLQKAGVAAVMANGMPKIRALAHLVSKADCDHDGVAEILETLGI